MKYSGVKVPPQGFSRPSKVKNPGSYHSIVEIEECIKDIQSGVRILVILRGLPGSGKSHLANSMLNACIENANPKDHIHSADNYFLIGGKYQYEPQKIEEAHKWNTNNLKCKMQQGYSPLFLDNTNLRLWEMKYSVEMAVINSYKIWVIEMNTKWSLNCRELVKMNQHNVPKQKIREMLERYEQGITADDLLNRFKLNGNYQKNPLPRRWPIVVVENESVEKNDNSNETFTPTIQVRNTRRTIIAPIETEWASAIQNLPLFFSDMSLKETVKTESRTLTAEAATSTDDLNREVDGCKIMYGRKREITQYVTPMVPNRPGMLDKGCLTENPGLNTEEDLNKLIDIFINIPPKYIKHIYDDCKCDFDITFDILLNDKSDYSHSAHSENEPISPLSTVSSNESLSTACSLPLDSQNKNNVLSSEEEPVPSTSTGAIKKRKKKKFRNCSFGNSDLKKSSSSESFTRATSTFLEELGEKSSSDELNFVTPEFTSDSSLELKLGEDMVRQLEEEFGDFSLNCPTGLQPVVQVPKSLARQIYALYIESMYNQMDNQKMVLDEMAREDEIFARKLYDEENCLASPPTESGGLKEIMKNQAAVKYQMSKMDTPTDLASLLSKKKLFELFPKVPQDDILQVYHANDLNYQQTVDDLAASVEQFTEGAREPPMSPAAMAVLEEEYRYYDEIQETDLQHPEENRKMAEDCLKKKNQLEAKARENFHRGRREIALYYSQMAMQQARRYEQANTKAAMQFLVQSSVKLQTMNTLDLHYLFVKEALQALDLFLDQRIAEIKANPRAVKSFLVITGRGNRSVNGKPRIRPAVIRRLEKRKIKWVEMNPGMLKIRINKENLVTSDLK